MPLSWEKLVLSFIENIYFYFDVAVPELFKFYEIVRGSNREINEY